MLVLTRKVGEEIIVGETVRVMLLAIRGNKVRLGVRCPESISVRRAEVSPEQYAKGAKEGSADA